MGASLRQGHGEHLQSGSRGFVCPITCTYIPAARSLSVPYFFWGYVPFGFQVRGRGVNGLFLSLVSLLPLSLPFFNSVNYLCNYFIICSYCLFSYSIYIYYAIPARLFLASEAVFRCICSVSAPYLVRSFFAFGYLYSKKIRSKCVSGAIEVGLSTVAKSWSGIWGYRK